MGKYFLLCKCNDWDASQSSHTSDIIVKIVLFVPFLLYDLPDDYMNGFQASNTKQLLYEQYSSYIHSPIPSASPLKALPSSNPGFPLQVP